MLHPHQQRVVDEKRELDEKLAKLLNFFQTHTYSMLEGAERVRLQWQANIMDAYSKVLELRIAAF